MSKKRKGPRRWIVAPDRLSAESLDPSDYERPTFGYHSKIAFRGSIETLAEWAQILGVDVRTLKSRLNRGWSVQRAFSTPAQDPGSWDAGSKSRAGLRMLSYEGERLSVAEWARKLGLNESTIHMRLARGATVAEALLPPGVRRRCSRCGAVGHNAAKCRASVFSAADDRRRRGEEREATGAGAFGGVDYRCGRCGNTGHNQRTCSQASRVSSIDRPVVGRLGT